MTGLSTPTASRTRIGPPPAGFRNARPCPRDYGTIKANGLPKFKGKHRVFAVCGYTPRQFRGAYGVTRTGLTGTGVKIGIVDAFAAGTIRKDANTYARRHGDRPFRTGQFSQSLPPSFALHPNQCQTPADWAGEETLDVAAAHGLATKAGVIYYGGKSCLNQNLQEALARVDDQNRVSVSRTRTAARPPRRPRATSPRGSRSSSRASCRASRSCSRPATTATGRRSWVTSTPTTRRRTRSSPPSAARPRRSATGTTCYGRPVGER